MTNFGTPKYHSKITLLQKLYHSLEGYALLQIRTVKAKKNTQQSCKLTYKLTTAPAQLRVVSPSATD